MSCAPDSTAISNRTTRARRLAGGALVLFGFLLLPLLAAGCAQPPQIESISPGKGDAGVSTAESVQITFDRPMDEASVAKHFQLAPYYKNSNRLGKGVRGSIRWTDQRTMVFQHSTLKPSTKYAAILSGGYRDALSGSNSLRHHWDFTTEGAPSLTGATPGSDDTGVDPNTYIALSFSRPMNLSSLASAISIGPSIQFQLRPDPAEPDRVLLAPQGTLYPNTDYSVTVDRSALDAHGNHLSQSAVTTFTTGPLKPPQHWIGFVGLSQGEAQGLYAVNDTAFPRLLAPVPGTSFSWSANGSTLLVRSTDGTWMTMPTAGGTPTPLPFQGEWAAFLGGGRGYAVLNGGALSTVSEDGTSTTQIATGVSDAAVSPDGTTVAFVQTQNGTSVVESYDVDLRARSRLVSASGTIDELAWAPDSTGLAYRRSGADPHDARIQVRSLIGTGDTTTLARGQVSSPQWQADARHVFFEAVVDSPQGPVAKVFRRGLTDQSGTALSLSTGIPTRTDLDLQSFAVSPDGREIAFLVASGGRTSVWVMNSDGTGVAQLASYDPSAFPYSAASLTWTPT